MRFLYPNGKPKALTFSYDDGQTNDIRLAEILRSRGLKGTFNLNSANLDDKDGGIYVNKNKLNEIYAGHEIALHGLEHKGLPGMPDPDIVTEIMRDKENLEHLTGKIVEGMAYAFGAYDAHIISLLRSLGIKYARTVGENIYFDLPQDFLAWDSTCHQCKDIMTKGKEFLEVPDWKVLPCMYVWGHSFEFEGQIKWSEIEAFADMMMGKDDIWYATNGEIYDYVEATRRLVSSFDGSIVKNPTAYEIWYRGANNTVCSIKPGETKRI